MIDGFQRLARRGHLMTDEKHQYSTGIRDIKATSFFMFYLANSYSTSSTFLPRSTKSNYDCNYEIS